MGVLIYKKSCDVCSPKRKISGDKQGQGSHAAGERRMLAEGLMEPHDSEVTNSGHHGRKRLPLVLR